MSPNEAQLRAALQAGQGESLDVDAVVSGAVQVQRARRHRLASAVGAVIVVAGVAGGSAALLGRDDGGSGTGSALSKQPGLPSAATPPKSTLRSVAAPVPAPGAAGRSDSAGRFNTASLHGSAPVAVETAGPSGTASAYASDGASTATAIRCPSRLPRLMLPGGGGTGQFGGDDPLFGAAVSALKVCLYSGGESVLGGSQVLTGAQAAGLTASLNGASPNRISHMCPNLDNGVGATTLAIYAVTPSGRQLRVVTATIGCGSVVTNGTAARYSWSPPRSLATLVHNHTARNTPASPDK